MPREPIRAPLGVNVPGFAMAGFQVTLHGRIWVTAEVVPVKELGKVNGIDCLSLAVKGFEIDIRYVGKHARFGQRPESGSEKKTESSFST